MVRIILFSCFKEEFALSAILFEMAKYRSGATGFTEDYTYDLTPNSELELAAHMLEISPVFAKNKRGN